MSAILVTPVVVDKPIEARSAPNLTRGPIAWARRNLFETPLSSVATVVVGFVIVYVLYRVLGWSIARAVFLPDLDACRALDHSGACWGVIAEKYRLILFGRYPFDQQWRSLTAMIILIATVVISCMPRFWNKAIALVWIVGLAAFFVLMRGGVFGLSSVDSASWGGLPLTLMLSVLGIAAAFPLAILVALGRRSKLPGIRTICIVYVELIRGVPLISVLFMASFLFPLFMPPGTNIDVLVRVTVGILLFTAAYLAEVVRGGLQAVPKGQIEAAETLGLSYWQTQRKIVLPQALRLVVPSTVNSFIATLKDCSLVTSVSLYELTGALQLAMGDSNWRPFNLEGYLFISLVYFTCCFAMSRYSHWVEQHLNRGTRRL
ncbi:amino acid ABC transporter permease [soil metagenome]